MTRSAELQDVEKQIDRMTVGAGRSQRAAPALAFRRLVVGVDGSPQTENAVAWASALARAFSSEVHLVTVIGGPAFDSGLSSHGIPGSTTLATWNRLVATERKAAEGVLLAARSQLAFAGVQATTEDTVGTPSKRIAQIAEERGADLVILGAHDPGAIERFFLGSVTDGVKQTSTASVLIAKTAPPPRHVLLPTDGSRASRAAVLSGVRLAEAFHAEAVILHVTDEKAQEGPAARLSREATTRKTAQEDAHDARVRLPTGLRAEVVPGSAADEIVARTRRHAFDLVVMGCRGLSGLRSTLAGSVSNPVSHRAEASVLLYKEGPG